MTSSAPYKPGQIVEAEAPYSDASGSKRRPVLIVTTADAHGDLVCLPITSQDGHPNSLRLEAADLAQSKLKKTSYLRLRKPLTFHSGRVSRPLAELTPAGMARIQAAMCHALNCCQQSQPQSADA